MAIYQIMRGCLDFIAGFGGALGGLRVFVCCRSFEAFGACEGLVRGLYTVFSHPYCQPIKGNLEM